MYLLRCILHRHHQDIHGDSLLIIALALPLLWILSGCAPARKADIIWPPSPSPPAFRFVGIFPSPQKMKSPLLDIFTSPKDDEVEHLFPYGIASDGKGIVYLSDMHTGSLLKYDVATDTGTYLDTPPGLLKSPHGITIDSKDNLYVVDTAARRVFVVSPEGRHVATIGDERVFKRPVHLALNEAAGRLYVSDAKSNRISVFAVSGRHISDFGRNGSEKGELGFPHGITVGPTGEVYVADMANHRVQIFDPNGNFLRILGEEKASRRIQFQFPRDLGFTSDGYLHVVDIKRAQLLTCTTEGVQQFPPIGARKPTAHVLGFSTPTSLFIDRNDTIFIVDQINRRFSVWQYLRTPERERQKLKTTASLKGGEKHYA